MKSFQPKSHKEYVKAQENHHTSNHHEYPLSPWHKNIFKIFRPYLKSPILDIGCRNGILLDDLERLNYVAYGIELTDIAEFAKSKGRKVVQGDIQGNTGFEDGWFKSAIMTHCIEHLHNPDAAIEEIKRIVDGYVFLAFPTHSLIVEGDVPKDTHYSAWSDLEDMENYLKSHKLEIVHRLGQYSTGDQSRGWADNEIIFKT